MEGVRKSFEEKIAANLDIISSLHEKFDKLQNEKAEMTNKHIDQLSSLRDQHAQKVDFLVKEMEDRSIRTIQEQEVSRREFALKLEDNFKKEKIRIEEEWYKKEKHYEAEYLQIKASIQQMESNYRCQLDETVRKISVAHQSQLEFLQKKVESLQQMAARSQVAAFQATPVASKVQVGETAQTVLRASVGNRFFQSPLISNVNYLRKLDTSQAGPISTIISGRTDSPPKKLPGNAMSLSPLFSKVETSAVALASPTSLASDIAPQKPQAIVPESKPILQHVMKQGTIVKGGAKQISRIRNENSSFVENENFNRNYFLGEQREANNVDNMISGIPSSAESATKRLEKYIEMSPSH